MPTKNPDIDPFTAVESPRAALTENGIVFPSLRVEPGSPDLKLVELGRVRADVAARLAEALQHHHSRRRWRGFDLPLRSSSSL